MVQDFSLILSHLWMRTATTHPATMSAMTMGKAKLKARSKDSATKVGHEGFDLILVPPFAAPARHSSRSDGRIMQTSPNSSGQASIRRRPWRSVVTKARSIDRKRATYPTHTMVRCRRACPSRNTRSIRSVLKKIPGHRVCALKISRGTPAAELELPGWRRRPDDDAMWRREVSMSTRVSTGDEGPGSSSSLSSGATRSRASRSDPPLEEEEEVMAA